MTHDTFTLDFPLSRQHTGLPIANGSLGVLLWGGGRELQLTAALEACWDHRFSEKLRKPIPYDDLVAAWTPESVDEVNRLLRENSGPEQPRLTGTRYWCSTRVGGGTFTLQLAAELEQIELEYATGTVTIRTAAGNLTLELDLATDQLSIADPAGIIRSVEPHPMWEKLHDFFEEGRFQAPERFEGGWFQPCPADPGCWMQLRKVPGGWRLSAALQRESRAPELPEPDPEAAHAWWSRYWQEVPGLNLPDETLNRFYRLALYKFAASTMPGKVPCSLQGAWQEDYQPPRWSNDYHFNVNVQQVYSLALPTGRFEHMLPLFDMLESEASQRTMRENARFLFGIDDGLLLTHAVDDRCMQVGGCAAGSMLDFVCGGWMAMLYWLYYRYTGDREFLRHRAMPFMRGVMNVFRAAMREDSDGKLMIPLAISAEYGCTFPVIRNGKPCHQNAGKNPSNQLTCCHALANALTAGAAALGEEADPAWREIKQRLPRFSTINGRVAIWEGQDLDVCHRHHSHLSMIYPFDLTAELTPEETEEVDQAIEHWIWRGAGQWSEWCYPWAMILQSRWEMQEAPSVLLEVWKRLFLNESLATVYLPKFRGLSSHRRADALKPKETNEVMQLDGTMAGATALLELTIHERGGVIELFPGIPEIWPDVEFTNVHLPGGLVASGVRRNGTLRSFRLSSTAAQRVRLRFRPDGEIEEFHLSPENPLALEFRD